ncbi:MAG: LiaI-LiaF-like domain-containing protein [Candidatus Acidiferrales bacterium]
MAEASRFSCSCAFCRIRGLMGPAMLITVGVIFLLAEYSRFDFRDLWPFLLIVAGLILVAQSMASKEGHAGR